MPLPKNFAILTRPRVEGENVMDVTEFRLNVLMEFPGAWKAIDEKWLGPPGRLKDGGLRLISENEGYAHYRVWFTYLRKGIAAREYREEEAEFEIWQHRNGFSLAVNAPRELAELAATFLSVVRYKDPFAMRLRRLSKEDFLALIRHTRLLGGRITILHLRHVKTEDMGELSILKISGKDMKEGNVDELLAAAKKITRLGFHIPNLGGEEFKFWIGHWGGGTIYSPSMSEPHHAWRLIEFFEGSFQQ